MFLAFFPFGCLVSGTFNAEKSPTPKDFSINCLIGSLKPNGFEMCILLCLQPLCIANQSLEHLHSSVSSPLSQISVPVASAGDNVCYPSHAIHPSDGPHTCMEDFIARTDQSHWRLFVTVNQFFYYRFLPLLLVWCFILCKRNRYKLFHFSKIVSQDNQEVLLDYKSYNS